MVIFFLQLVQYVLDIVFFKDYIYFDGPMKPKNTDTATTNPKDLVNMTRK